MSDLTDLYQQVILDHAKHPHNFHEMQNATHCADGHNPLCGDKIKIYLKIDGDTITDASFEGSGCAISQASCSLLTDVMKGKKIAEFKPYFEKFQDLVTDKKNNNTDIDLEKLEIFEGVKEFPMRVKCATLSWHTLKAALEKKHEIVKTE